MENANPIYIVTIVAYDKIKKVEPFTIPSLAVNFLNSNVDIQFETKDLTENKVIDKLAFTEYRGTNIFIRFLDESV